MNDSKNDCPKIKQHLVLYAGRDLEQPLCLEVEQHVRDCARCRAELAQATLVRERIAVLGTQTARGLQSVDLWPALSERLAQQRAAPIPTPAPADELPRVQPSALRRHWIPITIAAAALVMALRWGPGNSTETPPLAIPSPAPQAPAEDLASNQTPQAAPEGKLHRVLPGEERLRDSSVPLRLQLRPDSRYGSPDVANSLAGDTELR